MVRLGSLMEDLECYIDNSLVFGEDGKIIARKGGIRRYIQSEIPDLYGSYKTLMRYKALARRFRQAVGISDPVPAASVLPEECENMVAEAHEAECSKVEKSGENNLQSSNHNWMKYIENTVRTNSHGGGDDGVGSDRTIDEDVLEGGGNADVGGGDDGTGRKEAEIECGNDVTVRNDVTVCKNVTVCKEKEFTSGNGGDMRLNDEVKRVVKEILGVCEGTFLDLASVLALRISEDVIPHRSYKGDYRIKVEEGTIDCT
jgi:hypothetical protein